MARAAFPVIANEVRDLPVRILERIDLHVVDVHRAIAAHVAQQRPRRLGMAQRIAQTDELGLVAIVALQHAQILADQLVHVVAA